MNMKTKVIRILEAAMLALGICTLTSCFYGGHPYYGGPAYVPEYSAPYRYGPAFYPRPYVAYHGPVHYGHVYQHDWHRG